MSGGKRIDDHSCWISKDGKFPMGCKMKQEFSAEGNGAVHKYVDTTQDIKAQQDMGIGKMKSHDMKHGYRN